MNQQMEGGTMKKNRRGQMSLDNAPTVVVLIGLTFLIMATLAFIGAKYGSSFGSTETASVINETVTATTAGTAVAKIGECNFDTFAVSKVHNSTGSVIGAGNYTVGATGTIANKTGTYPGAWTASYTYTWAGTACTVTNSLQTEIANNTSIAGIVLTISLVGIVLSVLIGIFLVTRRRGV
jgi:hypothetical protein